MPKEAGSMSLRKASLSLPGLYSHLKKTKVLESQAQGPLPVQPGVY